MSQRRAGTAVDLVPAVQRRTEIKVCRRRWRPLTLRRRPGSCRKVVAEFVNIVVDRSAGQIMRLPIGVGATLSIATARQKMRTVKLRAGGRNHRRTKPRWARMSADERQG